MFVREDISVPVSFATAQARLVNLTHDGLLERASADAFGGGISGVTQVGPLGSVPGMSKLVAVHFRELIARPDCADLALRWEATGPGGVLFPALDADIMLTPDKDMVTLVTLAGVYRPPAGPVGAAIDRAILRRLAAATIRSFLVSITEAITNPERAAVAERRVPGSEVRGARLAWEES